MFDAHPLFDEYWAEKKADVRSVTVPAYAAVPYSDPLHADGTIRAWAALAGEKWLRIHNSQEWPDFYQPENQDDLRRFFDRYLKGIENGWEKTPRVRMAVLDPGGKDTLNRPADSFPPTGGQSRTLFLDARSAQLADEVPADEGSVVNDLSTGGSSMDFVLRFTEDVEIIGYPALSLWVSQEGHDDMDLYFYLEKLDRRGKRVRHQIVDFGLPLARRWMPFLSNRGVGRSIPSSGRAPTPAYAYLGERSTRVCRHQVDRSSPTPQNRSSRTERSCMSTYPSGPSANAGTRANL